MSCQYCGGAIDTGEDYRRVLAWERKSKGANRRSGSDIVLREPTKVDLWCCRWCADKLKRGVSLEQGSLLDGEAA